MNVENLIASGYCRTSNKYGLVSRLDRPDWKEYMAAQHAPRNPEGAGMDWVKLLGPSAAADQYRRCYSQDTLELGRSAGLKFPPSSGGISVYKEKV